MLGLLLWLSDARISGGLLGSLSASSDRATDQPSLHAARATRRPVDHRTRPAHFHASRHQCSKSLPDAGRPPGAFPHCDTVAPRFSTGPGVFPGDRPTGRDGAVRRAQRHTIESSRPGMHSRTIITCSFNFPERDYAPASISPSAAPCGAVSHACS